MPIQGNPTSYTWTQTLLVLVRYCIKSTMDKTGWLHTLAEACHAVKADTPHINFLALKWAVTEKFTDYLYGSDFTVVTDSNPLTYLLTSAKLDATSYRWLSTLSTFTFKIVY